MNTIDTEYRLESSSEDEYVILKELLDAGESFVSGSLLSELLGVSRPAIWGKLEKLKSKGFDFEAVRNRGYRLIEVPDVLHPALLRYHQAKLGSTIGALYFPVIDSTNNEAERQYSHRRKGPFAVVSSCQTQGRGRLGRNWHSASAENLYLSVLFEPNIPPQQLQHFTLWAGIHICRKLQSFVPGADLRIKWPNDLFCEGRKFAGMLTEARMDADRINTIIFGIGINLNSNPMQYPEEIRRTATSLHAVHGKALDLNAVAAAVLYSVEKAYNNCIKGETKEALSQAWGPLSALDGKTVTAIMGDREITGTASGIDESGALLLQLPDGSTQAVRAGDVTLKK
ncbi:biotin--[acetyl-CoA-carboxylase] ligase [Coraliomargarita parva]|uniref:biotin--[acetyl-CoA-carboxylase] ligase n=1 Tax=Coraliomargarita parva TaxID=3014050 RepID=UPI0022B53D65|nr:biotin--[acetyl-CoA-carboxylase] ligase [Coraliomargarita parva]